MSKKATSYVGTGLTLLGAPVLLHCGTTGEAPPAQAPAGYQHATDMATALQRAEQHHNTMVDVVYDKKDNTQEEGVITSGEWATFMESALNFYRLKADVEKHKIATDMGSPDQRAQLAEYMDEVDRNYTAILEDLFTREDSPLTLKVNLRVFGYQGEQGHRDFGGKYGEITLPVNALSTIFGEDLADLGLYLARTQDEFVALSPDNTGPGVDNIWLGIKAQYVSGLTQAIADAYGDLTDGIPTRIDLYGSRGDEGGVGYADLDQVLANDGGLRSTAISVVRVDTGADYVVSAAVMNRLKGEFPSTDEETPAEGTPAEGTPAEGTPAEGTPE